MELNTLITGLEYHLPINKVTYQIFGKKTGLIIVDEVNGFCAVGGGNLAPAVPNAQIKQMVNTTVDLAKNYVKYRQPVYVFRDTHEPGRAEPPYPEHCVKGTGEEQLVPELKFLESYSGKGVEFLDKDCINGFVGAITNEGNLLVDWINKNNIESLVVSGICTSICVLDFVVSILSARNHYINNEPLLPTLKDIVVVEPACADYDLPRETVDTLGLPATASHPQELVHHIGLSIMQARGAIIADKIV